jgi:hypothetical protein
MYAKPFRDLLCLAACRGLALLFKQWCGTEVSGSLQARNYGSSAYDGETSAGHD